MWRKGLRGIPSVTATLVLAACLLSASAATPGSGVSAASLTTLYTFCSEEPNCTDSHPRPVLVMDAAGNLYGVTQSGGAVFKLTPGATGAAWTESVISHVRSPASSLTIDASGNLYGAAFGGKLDPRATDEATARGSVFRLTLNPDTGIWTKTVLHNFCWSVSICPDLDRGVAPSGLLIDDSGILYGTTASGGSGTAYDPRGGGTVFELRPGADNTSWQERILYNFCSEPKCADGAGPSGGLIMDTAGNLYGTTSMGGAYGSGTVFELVRPDAGRGEWTHTILYSFCPERPCADGSAPSGLIMDESGTLYGTTQTGGSSNGGTVFALIPDETGATWTETVLYKFCSIGPLCRDGKNPNAGLVMDSLGNLYGTTQMGGSPTAVLLGVGTVFELTPDAASGIWREAVLYSFCSQSGCTDGMYPGGDLIMDASGSLYGTAFGGGPLAATGAGTVFRLTP
jgi:uncharacterized repeat protein (TIGR03803 family)